MSIDQGVVIDNLNGYLKWQNISLVLNENGVCNGLALVHAKYTLEGKEEQFFKILKAISKKTNIVCSEDVNQFVLQFTSEVLLSFQPKNYYKHISQAQGSRMLKVNGQFLESSFDFALAAKDEAWVNIFQKLALKKREVLQVCSADHTVSVYKSDNGYVLYDPNSGRKHYKNEKALVKALHRKAFGYRSDHMGLEIHLIRHPDDRAQPRSLPDIKTLYHECFHPVQGKPLAYINARTKTAGGREFRTLNAAAAVNNTEIIEYLLEEGARGLYEAARYAVYHDNSKTLNALLPEIMTQADEIYAKISQSPECSVFPEKITRTEAKVLASLAYDALEFGSHEAYQTVAADMQKNDLEALKNHFAVYAAAGGNHLSLKDCLARLSVADLELSIDSKGTLLSEVLLQKAIQSQSAASIQMLLDLKSEYSEEKKAAFLVQAIELNNYVIVDKLLSEPGFKVDGITLSTRGASHTALPVLKSLQSHGMEFSEKIQLIMRKKDHKTPIGRIESLGIILYQFGDYLREVFGKQKSVAYDPNFFKNQKKNEESVDEMLAEENEVPVEPFPF